MLFVKVFMVLALHDKSEVLGLGLVGHVLDSITDHWSMDASIVHPSMMCQTFIFT